MKIVVKKDLAPLKADAKRRVDESAERTRGLFITLGSGQAMIYQEKRAEAEAFMADQEISPSNIPHLSREASLTGQAVFDIAVVVLTMAEQWRVVSSIIEEIRLAAKVAIDDATTPAAIDAAGSIDWSDVEALSTS